MSAVVLAIMYSQADHADAQQDDTGKKEGPLVFPRGLTEGEKDFIKQNQAQLGSDSARQTTDYIWALWRAFRSIPLVFQLLAWMIIATIIIILPYIGMWTVRAIQQKESKARMIASIVTSLILVCVLLVVHLLF